MALPLELIAFMSGTMTAWIRAELSIRVMAKDFRLRASAFRMAETEAASNRFR